MEMPGCGNMENRETVSHIPTTLGKRKDVFHIPTVRPQHIYILELTKNERGKTGVRESRSSAREKQAVSEGIKHDEYRPDGKDCSPP